MAFAPREQKPPRAVMALCLWAALWGVAMAEASGSGGAGSCRPDRIDAMATVTHVHDGDTIHIDDPLGKRRKLRLIGIDSPEVAWEGRPGQPFAEEARETVARLLPPGTGIRLRYGRERVDKYHRLLAHAFLPDDTNLQAHLLSKGLATALVVPPNLAYLDCYAGSEARARRIRAGIWSLPQYRPIPSEALSANTRGFRIVDGRVRRVGESAGNIWLNLEGLVVLRIPRENLPYFSRLDFSNLKGRRVRARGKIYPKRRRKTELRITIRHPNDLVLRR
uniref:Endonuclease YncB, thermonuclease family n=1 Tax=Candidatus Kentrum sp. DK TaxID=2126562 RepID=A0A450RZR8_9GAMM|nr:MAG: Endonuclease YncB, thermonuclease family [Candidatus Kentron sp. DK]